MSQQFQLPKLPYAKTDLAPFMTEETFNFHYGKHHNAYITKLNGLLPGTPFENMTLEDMIPKSIEGGRKDIFNNAAQSYNHTFFWYCMTNKNTTASVQGNKPLMDAINKTWGSLDGLKEKFNAAGVGLFGSGWVWLAKDEDNTLALYSHSNAETPFMNNPRIKPIMVCDVWEHAYYIDYRNDRAKFLGEFWNHINWDFVCERFADSKLWEAGKLMKG